jgi:pyridine nucleotide-disulfide oxidoreductase family protein
MKKLVLAGAGHAHLGTILNMGNLVRAGCRVSVVSPADYHYYSGMGSGLLSGLYQPSEARFHVRRMVEARGGEFISARITHIQADNHQVVLSDNRSLDYDVLSCNMGSEIIPVSGAGKNSISVKPIENLYVAGREIERRIKKGPIRVLVIGGGAAGVELAGNLFRLMKNARDTLDITLVSKNEILSRYPPKMRLLAQASFAQRGIRVLENCQVLQLTDTEVILGDESRLPFDFAFNASGICPVQVFRDSGLPVSDEGGLLVNEFLQSVSHAEIFGGGDCVRFVPRNLDRVGVYAVRQGPVLYKNIAAALASGTLHAFRPQARYLSILNMGDGRGILSWRSCVFSGRLAFCLKNNIDKRFMKRFQVSGETNNP